MLLLTRDGTSTTDRALRVTKKLSSTTNSIAQQEKNEDVSFFSEKADMGSVEMRSFVISKSSSIVA